MILQHGTRAVYARQNRPNVRLGLKICIFIVN